MMLKIFNIPDFTSPGVIIQMNRTSNYYERLDYEFICWDSVIAIVHKTKTLQQVLEETWEDYPLITLSFILRKSIRQIQMKLEELGF